MTNREWVPCLSVLFYEKWPTIAPCKALICPFPDRPVFCGGFDGLLFFANAVYLIMNEKDLKDLKEGTTLHFSAPSKKVYKV